MVSLIHDNDDIKTRDKVTSLINDDERVDNPKHQQVVIVDDQSTGRTILSKVVQQIADNIDVIEFERPQDVLVWLESNYPDLIITDYRMPDMNGVDFIKALRKKDGCHDIPIMMITVVSEKEVRYDALDAGATAFLTRPIDQIECRTSCRNLLKSYEQHLIIQDRAEWLAEQVIMNDLMEMAIQKAWRGKKFL